MKLLMLGNFEKYFERIVQIFLEKFHSNFTET